jgi:hypothetical protein
MSTQSTLLVLGPCEIGLTRQATKTTGTNSSNASSILSRSYQSDPKCGDRCRHGAHDELLTDNALQITMQTMTKKMRTAAMQAAITVDGNRESHRDEGSHGQGQHHHPPSPRRAPPAHKQRSQFNPPPPAQYNPKQCLNDEDFCIQFGCSMFQSLTILGLGLGASETKIKVHSGLTTSEASTFFQLLNNTHQYLKDCA